MPAQIIDGKKIADHVLAILQSKISNLKSKPKLAVIYVGNDKPSKTYILRKKEAAEKIGMDFALYQFPTKISNTNLLAEMQKIQSDKTLSGLIVQLPLPKHLNESKIINAVKPELDADCLTDFNLQKISNKKTKLLPPTPAAIMSILKEIKFNVTNKTVTVVGLGKLVGAPLVKILEAHSAKVLPCDSQTKDTKKRCLQADLIITAVGKKDLITSDMIKNNAIIIDAGVCFENHIMYGDVNFAAALKKASCVTPTPGGVGPITVAMLLKNTYEASHRDSNV